MNLESKNHPDRLARSVHASLLAGSIVSALLFLAGLAVVLITRQPRPDEPPQLGTQLIHAALHGDGVALLDLGVIALMLTPILRILVLSVGWTLRRDYRFALIALLVLALLGISLAIALSESPVKI